MAAAFPGRLLFHAAMRAFMGIATSQQTCTDALAHAVMHMERNARAEAQVTDGDYGCDEALHERTQKSLMTCAVLLQNFVVGLQNLR